MFFIILCFIILCFIVLVGLFFGNKKSLPIFMVLVGLCIILMGYNYDNPDYENYVIRYDIATYPNTDNMLSLLDISDSSIQAFCKEIGVQTYGQYRLVLSSILFMVFGCFAYKKCNYCNLYLVLYILFYLILDIIQIRNFEAFVVLLPFIPLLSRKGLVPTILYIGGVLLSSTIHFSMVFFSIFALISIDSKRIKFSLLLLALVTYSYAFSLLQQTEAFERVSGYAHSSIIGALFNSVFVVFNYYILNNVFCKKCEQYSSNAIIFHGLTPAFIKSFNIVLLFIIPIFFINASIGRVFRYASLVNLIFMLNTLGCCTNKQKKGLIALILMYVFFFGYLHIFGRMEIVDSVMNNNFILNFLKIG